MAASKRDFERANRLATDSVSDWLPGFSEGRIDGDEVWVRSPLRDDSTIGSFSVNLDKGLFHDFASGDSGDLLSLYAAIKGIHNSVACDEFIARATDLDRAYREATDGVFLDDFLAGIGGPKIGTNQRKWMYSDSRCTFYVVRTDFPGTDREKEIRPYKYDDTKGWIQGKPEKPKNGFPILNRSKVLESDIIVVCEGEKKTDGIPPEYAATAWSSGANSVHLHDWTPLKGKKVILWPDNDEPGMAAMDKLQGILAGLQCTVLRITPSSEWGKGTDAGDFDHEHNRRVIAGASMVARPDYPFALTRYSDMELKPLQWIVKGLFLDNSLSSIFGTPGSGKSFIAVDLAACVASGADFHGHPVKRQGPVVYVAGEGRDGMTKRFRAWEIARGQSLSGLPLLISHYSTSLCDKDEVEKIKKTIELVGEQFGPVALIIIDTWARNMGGDENSTADTGAAIKAADDLRMIHGCAALIVHHSGKANSDAGRGSNALFGALDREFKVDRPGGTVLLTSTKIKDGATPDAMAFALETVDLGMVDEDGDSVTSAALKPIDTDGILNQKGKKVAMGKNQTVVIEALKAAGGTMNRHELQKSILPQVSYEGFKKIMQRFAANGTTTEIDGNVILS